MNQYIKEYGHCCNACRYYDPMSGYCKKTKSYHYGYDFTYGDGEPCSKWKIAEEFVEHRPKREKLKQLNIFDFID